MLAALAICLAACGRLRFDPTGGGRDDASVVDVAPGDASLACALYVNDTTTAGDVYTTSPGDDVNPGTATAPFATLASAIGRATGGEVICVDTGVYSGDLVVDRAVTLVGVRRGASACGRTGNESVIRGRVEVLATAGNVTIEGMRLERPPLPARWRGVNLIFRSSTFRLLDTQIVPSAPAGGFEFFGYVGVPANTPALAEVELRGNAFAPLRNNSGASAIALANVTVTGPVTFSANCFDDSGDGAALLVFGDIEVLALDANVIVNTAVGGAGGIGIGTGTLGTLLVTNNSISNAPGNGITLAATSIGSGTIRGNVIRGSGTGGTTFANIAIDAATILPPSFTIENNDLSAPAGTNLALRHQPTAGVAATCNWHGTSNATQVASSIAGNVSFSPFLVSGTDADPATPGFQPVAGSCIGQ